MTIRRKFINGDGNEIEIIDNLSTIRVPLRIRTRRGLVELEKLVN